MTHPTARTAATTREGDPAVAISLSLVLVLGIAVWLLHKYAGLKAWHGVVCVLFGFYLATSTLAPEVRTTVTAIIRALTGQG
jgi:F0F1-type ATP synthase assembly protein I